MRISKITSTLIVSDNFIAERSKHGLLGHRWRIWKVTDILNSTMSDWIFELQSVNDAAAVIEVLENAQTAQRDANLSAQQEKAT